MFYLQCVIRIENTDAYVTNMERRGNSDLF